MKNVEIFKMEKLVGTGIVLGFVKGKRMMNGCNEPSRIKIKLTTNLEGGICNIIIIDEKLQYGIDLDECSLFNKGDIIIGSLYNPINL